MAKKKTVSSKFEDTASLLLQELASVKEFLDGIPDDREWTSAQLELLEDIRWECLRLSENAEDCIRTFEGK